MKIAKEFPMHRENPSVYGESRCCVDGMSLARETPLHRESPGVAW